MIRIITAAMAVAIPTLALGQPLEIQPVTDGVWAIVGETEQRSPENLANNATFGLVVTDAGAVLIDPGGSYKGADMLHDAVRSVTDQPVRFVINTGGQDHRWLGNGYWQAQGATVIASEAAVADQQARGSMQMSALAQLLGDGIAGTEPSHADITFESDYRLDFGGLSFQIMHRGSAHTPGDAFVWLEDRDVMFTGDIVYVDRILGNGPARNIRSWIEVFDAMAAFDPAHIVPGHGNATDLATARRDTHDYLVNLRTQIGALIEASGDIMEAPSIDQSAWAYLEQFDSLAGSNAQATYEEMEWE
ncbi:MAG: MBL fold metallo-hydrolase [Hoeflea sp.]|uniref:MBL fold metallo-hydrolase n=1 Tax=Hoeflea sp. TaxID=1940281 RepID=UPI001DBD18AE|nr:MBL fold metallo-hydrolase [Hoeflea sp.]MBU4530508.1 MBL fold metallo-hydrolase [Alphaproteobacteria bacterium]MBU4545295.1 MBL fold metallo-hydrolase [Alphaproteobacteria bacterium]MBU4548944.1 MBL fold metallo-hydrolase [Alphaproteobacteria bacterium]MBV1722099.1 MBL fold metallo-hydrolase [Hoeflea sp.]MBV1761449.1 MBL fold metallo-hydrolase [Hoeflea sp.]